MSTENGGNEKSTIARVVIRNFRRLTFGEAEVIPETGVVRVTGPNAAGKTSWIKAIAAVFGGATEVDRGSLHEGSEKGGVLVELTSGYTIDRRISEASPKGALVVVGPDGGRHGQGKIDSWLGEKSFDPLAFLSLPLARQREILFSIGTDPELPQKLESTRHEYRETYERRTPLISRRRHLAAIDEPEGERPEPVDTSEEMRRLGELQAQERECGDALRYCHDLNARAKTAEDNVHDAEREVREFEEELSRARERLDLAQRGKTEATEATEASKAADDEYEKLPDLTEAMTEVRARLAAASEIQTTLEPWTRWDEAQEELAALREEESVLADQLGALEVRESDLLNKAGIPVQGLSFDDNGEPLLNGRSLALSSGRERVDLAVDVAIASDPDVRVCLVDEEANGLDLDAIKRLDERAIEAGFQLWLCRIGLEGAGEIIVENGVARDAEALEPEGAVVE